MPPRAHVHALPTPGTRRQLVDDVIGYIDAFREGSRPSPAAARAAADLAASLLDKCAGAPGAAAQALNVLSLAAALLMPDPTDVAAVRALEETITKRVGFRRIVAVRICTPAARSLRV